MRDPVDCSGQPRALGIDQGSACRAELGADYAALPWWERAALRADRLDAWDARVSRDIHRHFPRHSEELEGLARGAGVAPAWLWRRLARALHGAVAGELAVAVEAGATTGGALIARGCDGEPLLRRTALEGGFRTLEIGVPWFAGALAGVNEEGLGVAVWSPPDGGEPAPDDACAAPAALFVQDCLQRFGTLDASLEWCLRRPAGGRATLLFADAGGDAAAVVVGGDTRRVLRPTEGAVLAAPAAAGDLAKTLRAGGAIDASALARTQAGPCVVVDPAARRLGVRPVADRDAPLHWCDLDPSAAG